VSAIQNAGVCSLYLAVVGEERTGKFQTCCLSFVFVVLGSNALKLI